MTSGASSGPSNGPSNGPSSGPGAEGEASDPIAARALRGALASLVGGVVLEAVWGATARALEPAAAGAAPQEAAEGGQGVPCPPGTMEPVPCDPRGVAAWGALYGALQQRVRAPTLVHGLLLGVLVHAAGSAGLGVVPRATPRNGAGRKQGGAPVVAHVAYGLATAAAFEALRETGQPR